MNEQALKMKCLKLEDIIKEYVYCYILSGMQKIRYKIIACNMPKIYQKLLTISTSYKRPLEI